MHSCGPASVTETDRITKIFLVMTHQLTQAVTARSAMLLNSLEPFRASRVLLLQGPVGPFFARFGAMLEASGASVTKVNFNGGDCLFYPHAEHVFRGSMEDWPSYLERLLRADRFDWIVVFGDCRPVHRCAREVASRLGVRVAVFEEGYVRPHYVTLEQGGVNDFSTLPRDPQFYVREAPPFPSATGEEVGGAYWPMALWAFLYFFAAIVLRPWFPRYEHHRPIVFAEALAWLRSAWRKWRFRVREAGLERHLTCDRARDYFLVPLQVHNDAQVSVHSDFESVEVFVREVVRSFAAHAPRETLLAIKHHPLDRGYHDYTSLIRTESRRCGVEARVLYLHDQHLPSLLDHARGVVVINSTVGLQALDHGAPVKVCGRAFYDLQGLTFQGTLDSFWTESARFVPDEALRGAFKSHLIARTQVRGSFYRSLPSGKALGVTVPPAGHDADVSIEAPSAAE
jgi:capsular polysaccharide export protein